MSKHPPSSHRPPASESTRESLERPTAGQSRNARLALVGGAIAMACCLASVGGWMVAERRAEAGRQAQQADTALIKRQLAETEARLSALDNGLKLLTAKQGDFEARDRMRVEMTEANQLLQDAQRRRENEPKLHLIGAQPR